jgi:signal transduction histidine kinase
MAGAPDAVYGGRMRIWRAVLHALLGVPAGVAGAATILGVGLVWLSAIWSLFDRSGNPWTFVVLYLAVALAGPVVLLGCVLAFSSLQRARFRAALGIVIPAPPPGAWRTAAVWRQLAYHLLAMVTGPLGGLLVWVAPLAPALARADTAAARTLLGPGRADELAQRVESLARSRAEILTATDAERRRIERDLHDGAQQRLVSLALNLGMARANLADAPGPARDAIEAAHEEATQALAELREFVRGLHPAVLNDRGLDAALSGIVARAPLPVRLHVDAASRCAPSIEAIAYFVVSEALTNVAKHAHAGRAEVTVRRTGDRLRVVVADDGRGFDPGGAAARQGSGLRGLAQRVAAVDGTLRIDSTAGGPTTISVELPCES